MTVLHRALQTHETYTAMVVHQLPTGSTFAKIDGSEDEVFITASMARRTKLLPGAAIRVHVIPNKSGSGTKWFAIFAESLDMKAVPPDALPDSAILAALRDEPQTETELAGTLGILPAALTPRLWALHRSGAVARAEIYGQYKGVSQTLWGLSIQQFMGEE